MSKDPSMLGAVLIAVIRDIALNVSCEDMECKVSRFWVEQVKLYLDGSCGCGTLAVSQTMKTLEVRRLLLQVRGNNRGGVSRCVLVRRPSYGR